MCNSLQPTTNIAVTQQAHFPLPFSIETNHMSRNKRVATKFGSIINFLPNLFMHNTSFISNEMRWVNE